MAPLALGRVTPGALQSWIQHSLSLFSQIVTLAQQGSDTGFREPCKFLSQRPGTTSLMGQEAPVTEALRKKPPALPSHLREGSKAQTLGQPGTPGGDLPSPSPHPITYASLGPNRLNKRRSSAKCRLSVTSGVCSRFLVAPQPQILNLPASGSWQERVKICEKWRVFSQEIGMWRVALPESGWWSRAEQGHC